MGKALTPPIDDTWMMWPDPWARMSGSAAFVTHRAPNRLVSSWARACSSPTSSTVPKSP